MFDTIKLEELPAQAAKLAKDSAYFTVGLVVVSAQKTQEQWNDLRKQFEGQFDAGKDQVSTLTDKVEPQLKALDERFSALEARWEELVGDISAKLPEPAGKAVEAAFDAAKSARAQVRELWLGDAKAA